MEESRLEILKESSIETREYTKCMKNVIEKRYAEIAGSKRNLNKIYWFILHHGIYQVASQEMFKPFTIFLILKVNQSTGS